MEETGLPWQTLSHNVAHLTMIGIKTHNISGDGHWLVDYDNVGTEGQQQQINEDTKNGIQKH